MKLHLLLGLAAILVGCKTVTYKTEYITVGKTAKSAEDAAKICNVARDSAFNLEINRSLNAAKELHASLLNEPGRTGLYYRRMRAAEQEAKQSASRMSANAFNECLLEQGYVAKFTKQ